MKILRGSYPNDAWKLDGQNAEEFIGAMMLQLERYSDGDVLRAVGRVIDSARHFRKRRSTKPGASTSTI
jgi:hypothetical protein